MKTDFLKELGLTEEQISSIMKENGKDIAKEQSKAEKVNGELENLQSQLKEKDQLIADANAQIDNFKGLDVEGKDKAIKEWQEKYKLKEEEFKTKETEYQEKLQNQSYDFAIKEYANKFEYQSEFVKEAFINNLKSQGFKLSEDGKLFGADDYQKDFSEKNAGVFKAAEVQKPNEPQIQQFAASTNNGAPTKGISLMDAMKAANANQAVDIGQVGRFANQQ